MKLLNVSYECLTSDEEEKYDKSKSVYEQCVDISYHKALNVFKKTKGDRVVIGADTIVVFEDKIFGKPKNNEDAFKMLCMLSDKSHEVITAISILTSQNNEYREESLYVKTIVCLDKISDNEINDWINSRNVCELAGGYAIQESFGKYVKKIDGDYFNIVGLPINAVYQLLKKHIV